MTELDQLKTLLLADELEEINQLASKLKTLEFESYDEATITAKILPLFDTVLLKKLEEKESHTIEILSQHLAQVILHSSQKDLPALRHSLQTVVSSALSKEIEQNRDKMVDTLYPIMGGMISKYVAHAIKEMTEDINSKIEDGLSFNRYKRKVKAKVAGVSETELLIQENGEAHLSALFVIHKESGLLISEAHLEDHAIDDPHMVASMASAIKDFINDWVATHKTESTQEVQLMSYGENTLYIESAGSVYLIAFLDAEPTQEQRSKINILFAKIIKNHTTFLQHFDGDDTNKEVQEISEKMTLFLLDQSKRSQSRKIKHKNTSKKKKNPLKLILFLLGIGLIAYLLYQYRYTYTDYLLQKRILETTKQQIQVTHQEGRYHISGSVDTMEHFYTIKKLLGDHPFINALQMPTEELDQKLLTQNQMITQLKNNYLSGTKALGKELLALEEKTHTYASHQNIFTVEKHLSQETKKLQKKITYLENELQQCASHENLTSLKKKLSAEENDTKEQITQLQKKFDTFSAAYSHLQNRIVRIEHIASLRNTILDILSKTFQDLPALYKEDGSLDFRTKKLFAIGKSTPNTNALEEMAKIFNRYAEALLANKKIQPYIKGFIIEGYTDSSGNLTSNKALSLKRAREVKSYLLTLSVSQKYYLDSSKIEAKGMGNTNTILVYGVEDKEASRRIKLRFELDSEKLLKDIQSSIND